MALMNSVVAPMAATESRRAGGIRARSVVQSGARRHGKHGIDGSRGNVVSVSYRF